MLKLKIWPARKTNEDGMQRTVVTTARFDIARPLAFMHVPKTAGSALVRALTRALAPEPVLAGFDTSLFGIFTDFDSFSPAERKQIYISAATMPGDAKLILGHFSFPTLREAYPSAQIITVLREPVSRLLSHWLFWRQMSDEMLAPVGGWGDFARESRRTLTHFLSQPRLATQVDNVALRMLLWGHPLIEPGQFIDPIDDLALLKAARERMGRFAFAGIVEDTQLAFRLTSWLERPVVFERVNETGAIPTEMKTPLDGQLTNDAQDLLTLRSRLDLVIWQDLVLQTMPDIDCAYLRQQTLLRNSARYGALLSAP